MPVGHPENLLPGGWDFFCPLTASGEENATLGWAEFL
jgi:hypothetical protein